jgi:hypothetical protein
LLLLLRLLLLLLLLLLLQACDGARQVCRCPSPEELDADLDLLYRYKHCSFDHFFQITSEAQAQHACV